MKSRIVLFNLLIMVGYSVVFFTLQNMGHEVLGTQWLVLGIHVISLLIIGIVKQGEPGGKELIQSALLVALIGHGLCFMNGARELFPG